MRHRQWFQKDTLGLVFLLHLGPLGQHVNELNYWRDHMEEKLRHPSQQSATSRYFRLEAISSQSTELRAK